MMKKLLLLAFFGPLLVWGQSAGFNSTFIILSINGGANAYYDLQANTSNPDFNNSNLGTFNVGTTNLVFKGAEHNVWKCGGADITSTRLYYRIYPQNNPAGSYTSNTVFYNSGFNNGCGGQDQKWLINGSNVNLLAGLNAGSYTLEVYSDASTSNCCGGTIYAGNNGNNYKANFTIVCPTFIPGAISSIGETICSGGTPLLIGSPTAASGGDNIITYSWRSSEDNYNSAISGATGATYTPPAGLTSTTSYRRYAKDGTCHTTPTVSVGTWTVTVNAATTITAQTIGAQTTCQGGSTSALQVTATGTGTLTYQWYSNTSASTSNGTAIANANSASYTPSSTVVGTKYFYCVVNGTCGTGTSNISGAITINPLPTVSVASSTLTLCSGVSTGALNGSVGSGSVAAWYGGSGTWYNAANAAAASYTPGASETGAVTLTLLGTLGSCAIEQTVYLTVNSIPSTPAITAASSTSLCPNETVVLNVTGSGHQWYKDGLAILGAISSSYTANATGAYTVISTVNGCSSVASSPLAVDMNSITTITQQPTTAQQNGMGSPSLIVNATGNNLQFQWQLSTNGGSSWSDIAAPTGIANFYNPAPAVNSIYRCVVTGSCGSVTSNESGLVSGIPVITLSQASCGNILTSITTAISANNVPSAAMYRFTITPNIANASSYIIDSPDRWIALTEAAGMPLWYVTGYSITVAIQNGSGVWGSPGSPCTVTTPTLPATMLSQASCGLTMNSITTAISANNVPSAAMYRFTITPNIANASSYTIDSPDRWMALTEATGMPLWYGTGYSITVAIQNGSGVWGSHGSPCTVTTPTLPTTMLSQASCGLTMSSITTAISANNVPLAAMFRFTITPNVSNASSYTIDSPDRWIALTEVTGMPLFYGTDYSITVAIQNGSGVWGSSGSPCTVTTPTLPTATLSAQFCGQTLSFLTAAFSATNVAAATQYEFEITAPSGLVYTALSPDRWITLNEGVNTIAGNLVPTNNQTYYIKVRAQSGANWGQFDSEPCALFTPNPQGLIVQDPQAYQQEAEGLGEDPIEAQSGSIENQNQIQEQTTSWSATATSNPFEHSFKVNLSGAEAISTEASFTATLTDMSGKVYTTQMLNKEVLTEEHYGQSLAPGMYMLTLSQGTQVQVLRVVKR